MTETMRYFLESKCRSSWVIAVPPFALALMKNQGLPLPPGLR